MASTSDNQRTIAQKTWELSNNILEIAPGEEIYKYDRQQQQQMLAAKPWEKDHHFFKDIKVYTPRIPVLVLDYIRIQKYCKNYIRSCILLNILGIRIGPSENGYACTLRWKS